MRDLLSSRLLTPASENTKNTKSFTYQRLSETSKDYSSRKEEKKSRIKVKTPLTCSRAKDQLSDASLILHFFFNEEKIRLDDVKNIKSFAKGLDSTLNDAYEKTENECFDVLRRGLKEAFLKILSLFSKLRETCSETSKKIKEFSKFQETFNTFSEKISFLESKNMKLSKEIKILQKENEDLRLKGKPIFNDDIFNTDNAICSSEQTSYYEEPSFQGMRKNDTEVTFGRSSLKTEPKPEKLKVSMGNRLDYLGDIFSRPSKREK